MKKIRTILAAIALIAMIGTASAVSISGLPNGDTINRGEMITYTISVTGATDNVEHTLDMSGLDYFDVTIDNVPVTTWPWSQNFTGTGVTHIVNVTNTAAPNGLHILKVIVDDGLSGSGWNEGSINVDINAIPEFPTIALPIAAILGLAFIFQRRKEED